MQKKQTSRLQNVADTVCKQLVVLTSHMFRHAHTHNPVKSPLTFLKLPVIHKLHCEQVLQPFLLDSFPEFFILFFAQSDSCAFDLIFFSCLYEKKSPAASDIQQAHPLFQIQFL